MADYTYRAVAKDGSVAEGVIDASDEKGAIERLRNSGLIPLNVTAPKEGGLRKTFALRSARSEVLTFTTELSALLGAGLPLDRSLNIIAEVSEAGEMKGVVQAVLRSIREGSSFSDALQKHPRVFTRLYVNMVRAGEAGGILDVVLEKLNEFLESSKELKDHVTSAMFYPSILAVVGTVVIIFILTFVLPRFSTIFSDMGGQLPFSTQMILWASSMFRNFWWAMLIAVVVVILLFRKYTSTDEGALRWDHIKLKLMRDVIIKLEAARFCRTLGTLLKSGVPLLQALNNSMDIVGNRAVTAKLKDLYKGAKEGKGFAEPLASAKVFPPLAISMIRVGEETGQLDTMLLKVASTYEKSLREAIKRFMNLLGPIIIIIMAMIIGFIVISVFMAMFSIFDLPI
jgi:general secretion pathway protein F